MFAEAEVLMIWLPLIFETIACFGMPGPDQRGCSAIYALTRVA
jgi:hypothetical protein